MLRGCGPATADLSTSRNQGVRRRRSCPLGAGRETQAVRTRPRRHRKRPGEVPHHMSQALLSPSRRPVHFSTEVQASLTRAFITCRSTSSPATFGSRLDSRPALYAANASRSSLRSGAGKSSVVSHVLGLTATGVAPMVVPVHSLDAGATNPARIADDLPTLLGRYPEQVGALGAGDDATKATGTTRRVTRSRRHSSGVAVRPLPPRSVRGAHNPVRARGASVASNGRRLRYYRRRVATVTRSSPVIVTARCTAEIATMVANPTPGSRTNIAASRTPMPEGNGIAR